MRRRKGLGRGIHRSLWVRTGEWIRRGWSRSWSLDGRAVVERGLEPTRQRPLYATRRGKGLHTGLWPGTRDSGSGDDLDDLIVVVLFVFGVCLIDGSTGDEPSVGGDILLAGGGIDSGLDGGTGLCAFE